MKNKILVYVLCAVLLSGTAAACSGGGSDEAQSDNSSGAAQSETAAPNETTPSDSSAVSGSDSPEAAASIESGGGETQEQSEMPEESITTFDFSKYYEFEWSGIGMQFGGDAMADFVREKFNFSVNLSSNDGTTMSLRMVSDDLPHQFGSDYSSVFYSQCIADDYAYRFPDELLMKFPHIWDYVNQGVLSNFERENRGARYSIPSLDISGEGWGAAFGMGWHWRKDWAANLGLAEPKTMDEVYEVMRAFTFNDPTGTGRVTYGLTDWIFTAHFAPWLDYFNWYKVDGQWVPGYLTEEMVDGMRYWNKAFNDGIINPEANINNTRDEWAQGNVGAGVFHADGYWINQVMHLAFKGANPDLDPYDTYEVIGPFTIRHGEDAYWQWNSQSHTRVFDSKLTDDQIYRLLAYYDWTLSPEGRDFLAYGFLGVDWYVNEDGLAVEDREIDEDTRAMVALWNIYPSMGALGIGSPGAYTRPSQPPRWTTPDLFYYNRDKFDPKYNKHIYDPNLPIVNMNTPSKDEWIISLMDIETKMNEILTFSPSIFEQEWRAYTDSLLNAMGLKRILDEVNEKAAEMGL